MQIKKEYFLFSISFLLIVLIGMAAYIEFSSNSIVINEVCSKNFSVIANDQNEYSDYIELYNPTWVPVSLSDLYLSNDEKILQKCNLQGSIIDPRGYYIVYADDLTSFKISDRGADIFLSNAQGIIIDSVQVPSLEYNTSYARKMDGKDFWVRCKATPRKTNNNAIRVSIAELEVPTFSVESGFFDVPFELEILAQAGQDIYYTLDGSIPTQEAICYTGPIEVTDVTLNDNLYSARDDLSPQLNYVPNFKVDKATVIRAIAIDRRTGQISKTVTKTYFVNYRKKTGYEELPIISIVSDPNNLFDFDNGIYCNGKTYQEYIEEGGEPEYLYTASNAFLSGKESEREAQIEYFDDSHKSIFNQAVGIRIAGQATRSRIQKSFNLYAREIYDGNKKLKYNFFGDTLSSIKLRNGGNVNDKSKITDAFLHDLARNRAVATQASSPCVVFLNGEYWGVYNLRERYSEDYFSNHFDVEMNNVWLMDAGRVDIGSDRTWDEYQKMLNFADENDLSDNDNYAQMCNMIDIQSLIDFYCINLYADNSDVAFDRNIAVWRCINEETSIDDTKWHWMLYDLDLSLQNYTRNSFSESDLMDEVLIKSLMRNGNFRKQFCISFMDIVNSVFQYDDVHKKLNQWESYYEEAVVKSHQRFINENFSEAEYQQYINEMDTFFQYRSQYMIEYLAEEMRLEGRPEEFTVQNILPEGGSVIMNTVEIANQKSWKGLYYTDYPVTVKAVPHEGYRFVEWRGDVNSSQGNLEITLPREGLSIIAVFEKVD